MNTKASKSASVRSAIALLAVALSVAVMPSLGLAYPDSSAAVEATDHSAGPQIRIEQIQLQTEPTQPGQAPTEPQATCPPGGQCFQDVPPANAFYEFINRLYQQDIISGYACGQMPNELCVPPFNRPYYRPANSVNRQQMSKFVDQARRQPGIFIDTSTDAAPLRSFTSAANGVGVYGQSDTSYGVRGSSNSSVGVVGFSNSISSFGVLGSNNSGTGVRGVSISGPGVRGVSDSGRGVSGFSISSYGVYGQSTSSWAGYFAGDIYVSGNCTGCAGPSKIDHPLDPANKYLYHSSVESPDMMNIYNGNVTTDAKGEAEVMLPDYFEALNQDFRYQLTAVGAPGPNLYVAEKISGNRFKIAGGSPGMEVSWQVTGIRHDPYANAHGILVEEDKPADEKGKYLHPTEWGQPESKGVDYENQQMQQDQPK